MSLSDSMNSSSSANPASNTGKIASQQQQEEINRLLISNPLFSPLHQQQLQQYYTAAAAAGYFNFHPQQLQLLQQQQQFLLQQQLSPIGKSAPIASMPSNTPSTATEKFLTLNTQTEHVAHNNHSNGYSNHAGSAHSTTTGSASVSIPAAIKPPISPAASVRSYSARFERQQAAHTPKSSSTSAARRGSVKKPRSAGIMAANPAAISAAIGLDVITNDKALFSPSMAEAVSLSLNNPQNSELAEHLLTQRESYSTWLSAESEETRRGIKKISAELTESVKLWLNRLEEGLFLRFQATMEPNCYHFGSKQLILTFLNNHLMVRVGGGYCSLAEFIQIGMNIEGRKALRLISREELIVLALQMQERLFSAVSYKATVQQQQETVQNDQKLALKQQQQICALYNGLEKQLKTALRETMGLCKADKSENQEEVKEQEEFNENNAGNGQNLNDLTEINPTLQLLQLFNNSPLVNMAFALKSAVKQQNSSAAEVESQLNNKLLSLQSLLLSTQSTAKQQSAVISDLLEENKQLSKQIERLNKEGELNSLQNSYKTAENREELAKFKQDLANSEEENRILQLEWRERLEKIMGEVKNKLGNAEEHRLAEKNKLEEQIRRLTEELHVSKSDNINLISQKNSVESQLSAVSMRLDDQNKQLNIILSARESSEKQLIYYRALEKEHELCSTRLNQEKSLFETYKEEKATELQQLYSNSEREIDKVYNETDLELKQMNKLREQQLHSLRQELEGKITAISAEKQEKIELLTQQINLLINNNINGELSGLNSSNADDDLFNIDITKWTDRRNTSFLRENRENQANQGQNSAPNSSAGGLLTEFLTICNRYKKIRDKFSGAEQELAQTKAKLALSTQNSTSELAELRAVKLQQQQQINSLIRDLSLARDEHEKAVERMRRECEDWKFEAEDTEERMSQFKSDMELEMAQIKREVDQKERASKENIQFERESLQNSIKRAEKSIESLRSQLSSGDKQQKQLEKELEDEIKSHDSNRKEWQLVKIALEDRIEMLKNRDKRLKPLYDGVVAKVEAFRELVRQFKHGMGEMEGFKLLVLQTQQQIASAYEKSSSQINEYIDKYHNEMKLRKKFFDQVQELKGNIRVFCRARPLNERDLMNSHTCALTFPTGSDGDKNLITLQNEKGQPQKFEFDRVFTPEDDQSAVFSEAEGLVMSFMDGYNVCVFAYGQTGSG
jgi:predicted  nucleic acid-binding Zn-ribbon protein